MAIQKDPQEVHALVSHFVSLHPAITQKIEAAVNMPTTRRAGLFNNSTTRKLATQAATAPTRTNSEAAAATTLLDSETTQDTSAADTSSINPKR
jgi:hypothetical protein